MHDKYGLFCNCKLLVPVIEAMHKKLPAGPSKLLLCRCNEYNMVSFDISEGSKPDRLFVCSCTIRREGLRAEICDGIDPVSLF